MNILLVTLYLPFKLLYLQFQIIALALTIFFNSNFSFFSLFRNGQNIPNLKLNDITVIWIFPLLFFLNFQPLQILFMLARSICWTLNTLLTLLSALQILDGAFNHILIPFGIMFDVPLLRQRLLLWWFLNLLFEKLFL